MIDFTLDHDNLIERSVSEDVYVLEMKNEQVIKNCIEFFNIEITWVGMFDLDEANRRIKSGDKFFVGYHRGIIFGYCWLTKDEYGRFKVYNVFSRKTEGPRTYGATDMLYLVIKFNTTGRVFAEVDEWNHRSMKVFRKLGFNPSS